MKMAPTKENIRQQRLQAYEHLNAALDEFESSSSQEAIEVDTVQTQVRTANDAYADFVSWHNKFLDLRHEEAAMDAAHAEHTTAVKRINAAKVKFLALKRAHPGLDPIVPTRMASATEEGTRQRRLQALGHLNAALEDFDESRSRDAIDLNTVRTRIRAANIAYGRFVNWNDKFLDSHFEGAAMVEELGETTAAFKKINTAKAQFLALKRAHSGLEPSVPLAGKAAAGINPEEDPDDPNPGSLLGRPGHREGGKGGARRKGCSKRSQAGGNGPGKGNVDGDQDRRPEIRCMSFPNGLYSCLLRKDGRHREVGTHQGN